MSTIEAVRQEKGALFVSRAGADEALAGRIAHCLEKIGFRVVLQQWDFANANFIARMHEALATAERVVALLSPAYLESKYCAAEWQNAIAGDPLNNAGRLVLLRVAPCTPVGMLAGLAYWDLVSTLDDPDALAQVLRLALAQPARTPTDELSPLRVTPKHPWPTGIVTFLMTEIEDRTAHWERDGDAMRAAVIRYGAVLNAAIEAQRGQAFRGGDNYAAAFVDPQAALAVALVALRILASDDSPDFRDFRLRLALHSGYAGVYGDEYAGPAINRASALVAAAHGGQGLVSGAAAELLIGQLPTGVSLLDLGQHRLRDLTTAERVFQIVAKDLTASFGPLRTIGVLPNNLPSQTTRLIGREEAVSQVRHLVEDHHLVTLTGPGGIGKTRIALQVGADMLDGSGDGVWFIDLAPLSGAGRVAGTVAATLGLRESQDEPLATTLIAHLKTRRMLLLLDNCEHLTGEVASLANEILLSCPEVHLLATSREALNLGAEVCFRIPQLGVPEAVTNISAREALSYSGVVWFVERASMVESNFALSDRNASVVADICRRLDGIPLAIELAAARVNVLTVNELDRHLRERLFDALGAGGREARAEKRTLRAVIDWSFDLLSPSEQALFRRLAIFPGGCTFESANAVCTGKTVKGGNLLDVLTQLAAKSLIVVDFLETGARYRLLDTMRAYALDKLSSAETVALSRKRSLWFAARAERLLDDSWKKPAAGYITELQPEIENIRASLRWSLNVDRNLDVAGQIAGGLAALWQVRGLEEGRRTIDEILERWGPTNSPEIAALLWLASASLSIAKRRAELAAHAAELYEGLADRARLADALRLQAEGLRQMNQLEAAGCAIGRALELFREMGLQGGARYPTLLQVQASIFLDSGRNAEARVLFDEALRRLKASGDEKAVARVELQLAELERAAGNIERALALTAELIDACARSGDVVAHALVACNGAAYNLIAGNVAEARSLARAALKLALSAGVALYKVFAEQHLAAAAALDGDLRRGALLLGYVERWYREAGWEREPTEQQTYEIAMNAIRAALSEGELAALLAAGAELSEEEAILEARSA